MKSAGGRTGRLLETVLQVVRRDGLVVQPGFDREGSVGRSRQLSLVADRVGARAVDEIGIACGAAVRVTAGSGFSPAHIQPWAATRAQNSYRATISYSLYSLVEAFQALSDAL